MPVVALLGIGTPDMIDLMMDGNDFLEKIDIGDGESAFLDIGDDEDISLPGSPDAHGCQLFFAEHCPHWIQAKRSLAEPHRIGRLVAVEERVIAIDFFNEVNYFANHDVDRLVDIVGIGGAVSMVERFVILRGGGACFSILDADEPWMDCDFTPLTSTTVEALEDRLRTHGGYTVPGQEIVRQLTK
jgi:hypothetical protein